MFGHQDEPQQTPTDNTQPEPASDGTLDANIDALASSPDDTVPMPTPLLEEQETDGYIMSDAPDAATPVAGAVSDDQADDQGDPNTLLDIKQQALQQLSPLVGHLDQTPEERFRTTMMMIQASDNKALIPDAYEAARSITDEKAKAQALLDIVNEINYFTQHQD
jgi:hypothetical protein